MGPQILKQAVSLLLDGLQPLLEAHHLFAVGVALHLLAHVGPHRGPLPNDGIDRRMECLRGRALGVGQLKRLRERVEWNPVVGEALARPLSGTPAGLLGDGRKVQGGDSENGNDNAHGDELEAEGVRYTRHPRHPLTRVPTGVRAAPYLGHVLRPANAGSTTRSRGVLP